ncbi:MAG: flagellar hook-basal body complex protein FliE [Rhodothermales bacterium]|nr:flagellar hook-basal body complex protein FliE [Rhodothermales bacterium]
MTVAQLQRLRQAAPGGPDRPGALPQPGGDAFGAALTDAIDRVDGAQKSADAQVEAFVSGEQENLHEVVIAMNEAELYLQFMTEVRNRMLETYQELMRMQV